MRKITGKVFATSLTALLLIFAFPILSAKLGPDTYMAHRSAVSSDDSLTVAEVKKATLYESLNLKAMGLSEQAFQYALKGYDQLLSRGKLLNDKVLTIIDFSKPSTEKGCLLWISKPCRYYINLMYRTEKIQGSCTRINFLILPRVT